jgi:hypothetical protein
MAGTIYLVGEAMGQAMLELLKSKQETEPSVRQPMHVAAARQHKIHTTSKTKTSVKQKLSTSLALTVCACGLALLFTSGCSDKPPPSKATTPPTKPGETQKLIPEEDVAFFEKKYQKKITGVKAKEEYSDPDQFYSAIAEQLGIPEIAWEAASAKFGWKKGDGMVTTTMVKGGPTAGGGQGTWDVMFIRSKINPETKRPDPASMEQVMVQIDYDGNIKFPEIPKESL